MLQGCIRFMWAIALTCAVAHGETSPARPNLDSATPIATCKLQTLQSAPEPDYSRTPVVLYAMRPRAEDPLTNYERTPLGDWRMPADAKRSDPWLRLLVVAPERPVVVDLAIFIGGKPFRDAREAWIDGLLDGAQTRAAEVTEGNNGQSAQGTKPADAASEDESQKDQATSDEEQETSKSSSIAAQVRQAPSMSERLMNYLEANGTSIEREEIGWLLAEWGSGPSVVVLDPSLTWQRASLAPFESLLDQDADGALSAEEIAGADAVLKRADVDANDVVENGEIARLAERPAVFPFATGHSMAVILDSNTDWDSLAATLADVYAARAETSKMHRQFDNAKGLRELAVSPADVTLRVDFASKENEASQVSVMSAGGEFATAKNAVTASNDVITVDLGSSYIELSAAQIATNEKPDASATQIAIGAAIDGNPLLRLLDRDQDQRLTMRERQELGGLLAALDRDGDGQLGATEMPIPIRLGITLGPAVHQLLATPTGAARAIAPREAAPTAPAWFLSMDKNGDRDLSRGEFLGTSEQFRQFDVDHDGLLSVAEAIKLDTNN